MAHVSYVAQIQHSRRGGAGAETMRLLDPRTFQFTGEANYLNHPPLFYALLAALGPRLEGHPHALLAHRLINIAIAAFGFAALLGLGLAARLPRHEFYAYAVPLGCIPVLVPLAGAVNNDNLAFLGGAIAMLGVWQLVATDRDGWLALALVGVVAASWAKLTGFLLTGAMVSAVIAYMIWRKRLPWSLDAAVALVFALAAAPYVEFILRYGSPTPETPAQIALLTDGARAAGWADLPRQSFPAYLAYFVGAFVADWMPTLGARSVLQLRDARRFRWRRWAARSPVSRCRCAGCGGGRRPRSMSSWSPARWRSARPSRSTSPIATAAHLATGWLMDAYPRYYLPLIAIVPLAGLSLLAAIETPRWRNALLAFLIAGPVLFRLFGAPLG